MKKYIYLFIIYIISSCIVNAQMKFSKDIPNYIQASNSNFIINFITLKSMSTKTTYHTNYNPVFKQKSSSKISVSDYPTIDEALLDTVSKLIGERFNKLKMKPSTFINLDMQIMSDAEKMKSINEQYQDYKPGFVISIVCTDYSKATKALKKGTFTLEDLSPVSLSIAKPGETNYSNIYALNKPNMSLDFAFNELEKEIAKKGDSYFIKEMQIDNEIVDKYDPELLDKMLKENNSIEKYPDENDLKSQELLVLSYRKENSFQFNTTVKNMQKYYPYKFKVISSVNYQEYLNKGYKYILTAKGDMFETTKTGEKKDLTTTSYKFYYVIKDLETYDVYYGIDKSNLVEFQNDSPIIALKKVLKAMQEFYKWKQID